jgi:ABC-2 type transport system permease protein
MKSAMQSELLKLRSSRATLVLLLAGVAYAALNGVATAALAGRDGSALLGSADNLANILRAGNIATWVTLLAAILAVTGEHRHRTISTTYLATPRRSVVVMAKLAVYGATGASYAVLTMVVGLTGALPRLLTSADGIDLASPHLTRVALGAVVVTSLYGLAGIGVGSLVRNQTLATVGAIAWLVAAENLIGSLAGWHVARWLPGQAAAAAAGTGPDILLPMAAGAGIFAVYALIAVLLGARVAVASDIT